MEFRILGPLEVCDEGGVVALGGIKPRVVLAMLLLNRNEPVSQERLAQALWGDEAPATAGKGVQVHVSRLRKALGGGDTVTTTSAGYCIRVLPRELDAERFDRLVEDGRSELSRGQPEHAAALFREALNLWRGPPLADLAFEPFVQVEIARLEEHRLAALEARVEAELAAGWHAPLVGELQQLVATHPSRERLIGQLMLALYRCGRQADALESYTRARRVRVAELGLEPGPELRRLHDAILHHDASLELPPAQGELPRELEVARAQALFGRDAELGWLREQWERARSGKGALIAVTGPHGIGKTRLVAELASEACRLGFATLHANGADTPERLRSAVERACQATRPTLLVLDDADSADAGVLAELEKRMSSLSTLPVLVLCTSVGVGEGHPHRSGGLNLGPLGLEAVRAITAGNAPAHARDQVPAEWLLEVTGGVPKTVHEASSQWARREAASKVGAAAQMAAGSRRELRTREAALEEDVEELQATRRRTARAIDDDLTALVCPYKGLASFDVADAEYYFGRERLIAELVARLVGAPLLAVVGPSGSGKSSALRAGLLPALASGTLPGSAGWGQEIIRPGEHPLSELERAVARLQNHDRVVLAVDQFEEMFTACADEDERGQFVATLTRLASARRPQATVVLAIRADFYGRCSAYPELASLLAADHVLVGPMTGEELRRAVERPAQRAGLRVEPELTDALVGDVEGEPGALPLLSTALLELWERRDGSRLRHAAYERTGGVRGAVARLAEDAFAQLQEAERPTARNLLLRLVEEPDVSHFERRRISLDELEPESNPELAKVLAVLIDRRLVTVGAGSVEIAHESLLREWPRLREWLEEDSAGRRLHRHITDRAREWDEAGRDPGDLERGPRLATALEWQTERQPHLTRLEREFLGASEAHEQHDRAAHRNRVRLAFAGLAVALAVISAVAIVALDQRSEARHQRTVALSRQLAANANETVDGDPGLGLALARRAVATEPTTQAVQALRQAVLAARALAVLRVPGASLRSADLSPDGKRAVGASEDGVLIVWNLLDGREVLHVRAHKGPARASFGPRGEWIASAGEDGAIVVTDARNGTRRKLLTVKGVQAGSIAVSADGKYVAAGFSDGTVRVVDTAAGGSVRVLRGEPTSIQGVAISEDDRLVAGAGLDGALRVWELGSDDPPAVQPGDRHGLNAVNFDPGGRRIVTADESGWVHVWSVSTPGVDLRKQDEVRLSGQAINAAAFSPDGRRLATAGTDGTVRVLDARVLRVTEPLRGHAGRAFAASFSDDGDVVVSSGEDGTVRTWDPGGTRVMGPADEVTSVQYSPDEKRVIAGSVNGPLTIWNVDGGQLEAELKGHNAPSFARFSRDGNHVVSASYDGSVRVWSGPDWGETMRFSDNGGQAYAAAFDGTGRRIVTAGLDGRLVVRSLTGATAVVLAGHRRAVNDASFSPDDRRVISAGADGTIRIWNAQRSGPASVVLRGHVGGVATAAFSADGRKVVSAGDDGTVRIWDIASKRAIVLRGHDGPVLSAAFSSEGDRVVSGGIDETVRIWDAHGGPPLVTLREHPQSPGNAVFNHDGARVLSSGMDGIWITPCEVCRSLSDVLQLARTRAGRRLTVTERQRFEATP